MAEEINKAENIGVILLAAGGSSRLGKPKQLLVYHGQSLLKRAIIEATSSNALITLVVLGKQAALLQKETVGTSAKVVVNDQWEQGMASSIQLGVNAIIEMTPSLQVLIIMMCDQPHVKASLLNELIAVHQYTGKPIVTCTYANTFGPPTLFNKKLFSDLLQLRGDVGARSIIQQHADEVEIVAFPEGNIDVDTEEDYQKLSQEDV